MVPTWALALLFIHLKVWSHVLQMEGMILEIKGLSLKKGGRKTRERRGGCRLTQTKNV